MIQFIDAKEIASIMGISLSKSYEIIRELNSELKEMGYLVVRGKVSRAYFQEKCLYEKEGCRE